MCALLYSVLWPLVSFRIPSLKWGYDQIGFSCLLFPWKCPCQVFFLQCFAPARLNWSKNVILVSFWLDIILSLIKTRWKVAAEQRGQINLSQSNVVLDTFLHLYGMFALLPCLHSSAGYYSSIFLIWTLCQIHKSWFVLQPDLLISVIGSALPTGYSTAMKEEWDLSSPPPPPPLTYVPCIYLI